MTPDQTVRAAAQAFPDLASLAAAARICTGWTERQLELAALAVQESR